MSQTPPDEDDAVGQFAQTRSIEEQVLSPKGVEFTAEVVRVINAETDPDLLTKLGQGSLNSLVCPESKVRFSLDTPVVVHLPQSQMCFLVIPEGQRDNHIKHRIDFLSQLALQDPQPPPYVLDFRLFVLSPDQNLRERLDQAVEVEAERVRLAALLDAQKQEKRRLEKWAKKLAEEERRLKASSAPSADDPDEDTVVTPTAGVARDPRTPHDTAVDHPVLKEPSLKEAPTEAKTSADDDVNMLCSAEIEIIDGPEGLDEFSDTADEGNEEDTENPEDDFLDGLSFGKCLTRFEDGRLQLHFLVQAARLRGFLGRRPSSFIQFHRIVPYPVVSIALVARDESDLLLDELFCAFDIQEESDRGVLESLAKECRYEVHLYDEGHQRMQFLEYSEPFEGNITYLHEQAVLWLEQIPSEERSYETALGLFSSDGFERIGARKHNLLANSFARIKSIGAARISASIVSYWSEAQNFEYLIEKTGFPLEHFRHIQRRVVKAAIRYGIFLPVELRLRAIDEGLAETQAELIEMLIECFAKLLTGGTAAPIDSMAASENWDKLLTACVDLGVTVDLHVRELADTARRRSRRNRVTAKSVQFDLAKTSEYERISSVSQASNEDLQKMLGKGGLAPAVARELLGRGGETNILCVIEGARVLDEEDLQRTARFLAAGADEFEPALLLGLGRVHGRTVQLCALALAMAKRVEALPALIELLHDQTRSGELPIKEIIAEYGSHALPFIFRALEGRGATDELVETLALISVDHGSEIISALRESPKQVFLEAAQKMSKVRRELGSVKLGSPNVRLNEGESH